MSMPNPDQVYYQLYKAISEDKRPCLMLQEYLNSGGMAANVMKGQIFNNKKALALLTSPMGRKWLHKWMDDFLNYLEQISRM